MTEALNMLQVYLRQAGTVFKCVMVNKFYIIAYIDFLQLRTACKSVSTDKLCCISIFESYLF